MRYILDCLSSGRRHNRNDAYPVGQKPGSISVLLVALVHTYHHQSARLRLLGCQVHGLMRGFQGLCRAGEMNPAHSGGEVVTGLDRCMCEREKHMQESHWPLYLTVEIPIFAISLIYLNVLPQSGGYFTCYPARNQNEAGLV
jgi:hypothetical protein